MQPDGVDETDKMADAKCLGLKMPADGVGEIEKIRDARCKRSDEMESAGQWKYGVL